MFGENERARRRECLLPHQRLAHTYVINKGEHSYRVVPFITLYHFQEEREVIRDYLALGKSESHLLNVFLEAFQHLLNLICLF